MSQMSFLIVSIAIFIGTSAFTGYQVSRKRYGNATFMALMAVWQMLLLVTQ